MLSRPQGHRPVLSLYLNSTNRLHQEFYMLLGHIRVSRYGREELRTAYYLELSVGLA
jgi:hypothetical protein